ncbi:hypothetical protein C8Q73DRAFT_630821, partial [Cubamyces lactineus]
AKDKKHKALAPTAQQNIAVPIEFLLARRTQALATLNNASNPTAKHKKDQDSEVAHLYKKVQVDQSEITVLVAGFKWDSVNYSCAYNSVLTILLNVWIQSKQQWGSRILHQN